MSGHTGLVHDTTMNYQIRLVRDFVTGMPNTLHMRDPNKMNRRQIVAPIIDRSEVREANDAVREVQEQNHAFQAEVSEST